jgi:hypothetical protein
MKKLGILIATIFIFTNLFVAIASTASECDSYLKDTRTGLVNIWRLAERDRGEGVNQLIECASPEAAKTEPLSPLRIFQIIIDAIAYLAFALSIIAAIVAIIQIATSAGDKTKFQAATDLLKNSALAFIISISAYSILFIFLTQIGFNLPQTKYTINQCLSGNGGNGLINGDCSALLVDYPTCISKAPGFNDYCSRLFCQITPKPSNCPII